MEPNNPTDLMVVIPEPIENSLIGRSKSFSSSVPLSWPECMGLYRLDEGHILLGLGSETYYSQFGHSTYRIPCFILGGPAGSVPSDSINGRDICEDPFLLLIVDPESDDSVTASYITPGDSKDSDKVVRCSVKLIGGRSKLFNRISSVIDLDKLQDKKVAVIGLGSGGGLAAVELTKSGVGSFILVDYDKLEVENVTRHVCGLADVGRWKTRSIRDQMLKHNPNVKIECHEVDITEQPDLLETIVDTVDLVFVATDSEISKYMVNEQCVDRFVPAVYGGVYERAFAGEIVLVTPGRGGCYSCVRHNLANSSGIVSSSSLGDYTDDTDVLQEPGLGIDVGFIANLHIKIALSVLLNTGVHVFENPEDQMIIWVNSAKPEDGPLFATPLARYFVKVPRIPECRTCGALTNYDEMEYSENE